MTKKIAVAVIHGMGDQSEDFADAIATKITNVCAPITGEDVVIRPFASSLIAVWQAINAPETGSL